MNGVSEIEVIMMRKQSVFLKVLAVLLIIILLLGSAWVLGRYSWKLFGFSACSWAGVEEVQVEAGRVRIVGFYPGSFPMGFLGYHAEQLDDTLYVGFRFSAWFGLFETGDFDITIPVEGEITQVVLKDADNENVIWQHQEPEPVISAVSPNQDISSILEEDEPVMVKTWFNEWEMECVSVISGTNEVELGFFGRMMEACALRRPDGRSFVMVTCDYMSDDFVTFLCEVTGGTVRLCSELERAYPAAMPTDTDRIPMVVQLDVLGSYRARMDYDFQEDGTLVQAWDVFTIDRNHPMTVIKDLPVTVDGAKITLDPGTQIVVTGTNDAGEAYFRVPDTDLTGTIHYTLDEEYSWVHLIDGVSEYEYLDCLPYAG